MSFLRDQPRSGNQPNRVRSGFDEEEFVLVSVEFRRQFASQKRSCDSSAYDDDLRCLLFLTFPVILGRIRSNEERMENRKDLALSMRGLW
jgi:hypothetical protein